MPDERIDPNPTDENQTPTGAGRSGEATRGREKRENPLLNIGLNIILPAVILMRFTGEDQLGPVWGLVVALAFPVGYGIYDFVIRKSFNFYSVLGFVSVLLTGGIGLLKLPVEWLAIKEASVPLILAIAVLVSLKTRYPLVKTVLGKVIDQEAIYAALRRQSAPDRAIQQFEKRMTRSTFMIAFALFVSAGLNYALARIVVVSEPGTTAFNEELGRMTALSLPVITGPSLVILVITLYYLVSGIMNQTGLEMKEIIKS